ncbi:MAG TPA: bifunctional diaminohydroxyphosphoribosylaminopyrimidine deaminase/5-amino-6-(5-phosphoribosylamino)uracil reductase RibD [bacterium]
MMALALSLARRGAGRTSPNPAVGAVVVKAGRIVGEGFHRRAGGPHAELIALRRAGVRARGATLYVTLEPCAHYGRTPPCADAVIRAGITRVVAAADDPNPLVSGRGYRTLRRAGVRVRTRVLAAEARRLNPGFEKAMRTGQPYVVAKIAQSLDGKIAAAGGQSKWITGAAARRLSHRWRAESDAVMVGINTVLRDDPRLSARVGASRQPLRVIVDSRLRTPVRARCLAGGAAVVAACVRRPAAEAALRRRGASVVYAPGRGGRVSLRALGRILVRRGVRRVLLEGGGELLAGALAERVVDEVRWWIAPVLLGGRRSPSAVGGAGAPTLARAVRLSSCTVTRAGRDWCVTGRVRYPL